MREDGSSGQISLSTVSLTRHAYSLAWMILSRFSVGVDAIAVSTSSDAAMFAEKEE